MSVWRRAVRVAKANLSDLARRAGSLGKSRPLDEMSDAELEAELERRRAAHAARAAARAAARRDGVGEPSGAEGDEQDPATKAVLAFAGLSAARRREVRQYYANLELPFGASLEEVKHAYRRLMRQYHPDKHEDDAARRQVATQLSQKLTVAYNELSRLLGRTGSAASHG
jgi:DnaJ-domain-containing protein 1